MYNIVICKKNPKTSSLNFKLIFKSLSFGGKEKKFINIVHQVMYDIHNVHQVIYNIVISNGVLL